MKTYISYRPVYLNKWAGKYTLSYFLDQQYSDYVKAWITKIDDIIISDNRYTKEIVPWIKSERRFAILEANWIDLNEFKNNVMKIANNFDINDLWDIEEAKAFIREYTNLEEVEEWKFLIQEASEIDWEVSEDKYLIIE